MYRKLSTI